MDCIQTDEQLHQLKAQNRWLRLLAAALLAFFAAERLAPYAKAAVEPAELTAQRFVLRDAHGQERAVLAVDSRGTPRLTFYGRNGSETYSISGEPGTLPVK